MVIEYDGDRVIGSAGQREDCHSGSEVCCPDVAPPDRKAMVKLSRRNSAEVDSGGLS